MNVTLPNGAVIQGVPEGTPKDEIARKAISAGLATEQDFAGLIEPQQPSMLESVADVFTGKSRQTRATQELPELPEAAGFLAGEDMGTIAKVAPALLTTTDPQEMADILRANFPNIGIQYDEKGNIIAGNNRTGQRVVLNKPGVSTMDVLNTLGIGSLAAPAGATRAGATGLARVGQIAGQSGLATAGMEAAQAGVGGEFNLENVLMDMAAAGAIEAVPAVLKAYRDRSAGTATRLGQEATEAEAARVGAALSPEAQMAQQREITEQVARQAQARRPDLAQVASDVAPDPAITGAAERLGVAEQLTPGQTSRSQSYRELEGALSAVPGSQLSVQQKDAATAVAQKADDFITEFGGTTDKAGLSERLKGDLLNNIDDLDNQASQIYREIDKTIPKATKVDTSNIAQSLREEADMLGGEKYLEPIQRRVLKIAESEPSYALLDKERRKVGEALRKSQGPYKDADTGTLKQLYRQLTEAQEVAADAAGAGEMWASAKGLVSTRKELEDQSLSLLGRDKAGAIMPKVGRAVKKLGAGDYRDFDNAIAAIPKENRQEVVLTALNDVFTAGSRKEKQLSPAGFADWYESLSRNKAAKKRITDNLPEGAAQRLDDIYQVSKGLRQASAERVRTGVIQGLLKDFDQSDSWLSKLYQTGKTVAAAEGATTAAGLPGAGTTGVIVDALSKRKNDPIAKSADALLASHEFKNSVKAYADKSVKAKTKQAAADRALQRSEKYQKWLDRLPEEDKRQVMRVGLMTYLSGEQEQPTEQR